MKTFAPGGHFLRPRVQQNPDAFEMPKHSSYAANRSPNGALLTLRTYLWGPIGRVRVLYFSKDPPTRDPMGRQGPSGSYGSFIRS
jgi:hypothetical protein